MTAHPIDGTLATWPQVRQQARWRDLLVGNGLSRNVSTAFSYDSLYEQAPRLAKADRKLFEALKTQNFEVVLAALASAIETLEALANPAAKELRTRYRSVQGALGGAVREVHIPLSQFPLASRQAIKRALAEHRWVFTTNYDLLLYWSAGAGESFAGFADYFHGEELRFDPQRTRIPPRRTRLLYLHGALHLTVNPDGTTTKTRRSACTLLAQFDKHDPADPNQRPLIVAEGSSQEKATAIRANEYLSFALQRLAENRAPLVIFGLGLREEDSHLVDALNTRPSRPLAVSIRRAPRSAIRSRQAELRSKLAAEELMFFDAATHPLGSAELAVAPASREDSA